MSEITSKPLSVSDLQNASSSAALRFVVFRSEVLRLPHTRQEICVLTGVAWITVAGKDRVLTPGETVVLTPTREDPALVSVLNDSPLVLEIAWAEALVAAFMRVTSQHELPNLDTPNNLEVSCNWP